MLINGAGPARTVHRRAPRYVFQTGIPYAAYGPALLDILQAEGISRPFVLARDEPASREMAEGLRAAAAGEVEVYRADVVDFKPFVEKALAANADAWIAFGGARDTADMVRTFRRMNYAPRLFFARGAAEPKFVPLVGQDAEFSARRDRVRCALRHAGQRGVRQGLRRQVVGAPPGPAAAEGYAAATVAAAAVRRAGGFDQEKLRAALAALRDRYACSVATRSTRPASR